MNKLWLKLPKYLDNNRKFDKSSKQFISTFSKIKVSGTYFKKPYLSIEKNWSTLAIELKVKIVIKGLYGTKKKRNIPFFEQPSSWTKWDRQIFWKEARKRSISSALLLLRTSHPRTLKGFWKNCVFLIMPRKASVIVGNGFKPQPLEHLTSPGEKVCPCKIFVLGIRVDWCTVCISLKINVRRQRSYTGTFHMH